jgi:hypothetical protein
MKTITGQEIVAIGEDSQGYAENDIVKCHVCKGLIGLRVSDRNVGLAWFDPNINKYVHQQCKSI